MGWVGSTAQSRALALLPPAAHHGPTPVAHPHPTELLKKRRLETERQKDEGPEGPLSAYIPSSCFAQTAPSPRSSAANPEGFLTSPAVGI